MIPDLSRHPVVDSLPDVDLGRLVTFAGSPLRHPTGEIVGWVAVLDTVRRAWTPGDRELLDGIVGLARSAAAATEKPFPAPPGTLGPDIVARDTVVPGSVAPDIVRLADQVAQSLTVAGDGVAGLVRHASGHEDPVLQRHAGVADRHLEVLRAHATRLRSSLAGHPALEPRVGLFDLGVAVRTAVREAAATLGMPEPACTIPEGPLSVSGNAVAVKRALVQLLSGILVVAAPESVTVGVQSHATASGRLDGTLTVELRVAARGVVLSAAELSRAVAGALAKDSGVVSGPKAVRLSVAGSDIRLDGPGLRAWTSTTGTTVALRWPVDLG